MIPPASLHLMVIGPISVAVMGYLFAVGDASAVLRSTLVGFPLMFAVMIPLLLVIGAAAVGYGWLAWGIGEGTVLVLSARKHATSGSALVSCRRPSALSRSFAGLARRVEGRDHGGRRAGRSAICGWRLSLRPLGMHRTYLLDSIHLSIRGLREVLRSQAPK